MAKSTRLDRSHWGLVQHGNGVPGVLTKGNFWLDDLTGISWTKTGSTWGQMELGDLWTRTGTTLSPSTALDGLSIVSDQKLKLETSDTNNDAIVINASAGSIDIDALGNLDIDAGANISLDSTSGGISLDTQGTSKAINIGVFSSATTSIQLGTVTTPTLALWNSVGSLVMNSSGLVIDVTNQNIDISTNTTGNMLIDSAGVIDITAEDGQASVYSKTLVLNGIEGIVLTNEYFPAAGINIAGVSDAGGGDITVSTSGLHYLTVGDSVILSGSSYDGTYEVKDVPSTSSFDVTAVYTGTSSGTATKNESIGDDGPVFLKIPDRYSATEPLHLYSQQSDILIETVAGSCENDIKFISSDNILATAVGAITLDSAFSSHLKITANDVANQTLTIDATNAGAGDGNVEISAEDLITLDTSSIAIECASLSIDNGGGAVPGWSTGGSVACTNITVINGIVTAVS